MPPNPFFGIAEGSGGIEQTEGRTQDLDGLVGRFHVAGDMQEARPQRRVA